MLHATPADDLVRGFKYKGWTALAPLMGQMMTQPTVRLAAGQPAVLVPVPLDPARLRRRGFNQAALLAAELSRTTGLPWAEVLARTTASHSQAALGREDRARNVLRMFKWQANDRLPLPRVILVDDVLTTGATSAACARTIEEAGYECLGVATFARALHRPDEA